MDGTFIILGTKTAIQKWSSSSFFLTRMVRPQSRWELNELSKSVFQGIYMVFKPNAQSFSHDDQNLIIFVQVLLIVIHQQPTMDAITLHMNQFYCLHAIRRVYTSPQRLYPWLWLGTGIHAPKPVAWSSDRKKKFFEVGPHRTRTKETPKISHQLAPSGPQTRWCLDPWLVILWISRFNKI